MDWIIMIGKKYAIHPGYVVSKFDGDEHYITFDQLIKLYGLDRKQCFRWDERQGDSIHLYPKYSGEYKMSA